MILVILAHPKKGSFNHAIAEEVTGSLQKLGFEVRFHDLYAEGFDPVLPFSEIPREGNIDPVVAAHCEELAQAEGIVVIHPNWWGQPPAILKGWIDRVVRPGVAYEFVEGDSGEGVPRGLVKAKAAVVFNTSNTKAERELRVFGDPLETIWRNCIFGLCGVHDFTRRVFETIVTSTDDERKLWLEEAAGITASVFGKGVL